MNNSSLKSVERLVSLITFLLVLIMAARMPLDSDFWWHISAGEWSWQNAHPMLVDYFSFTRFGQSWINHSWLAEVIYYLVYINFSYYGLTLLVSGLATLSMVLVYLQMQSQVFIKAFLIIFASAVAAFVWSPRPQMFSLVLLAAVGFVLYRFNRFRQKRLWLLPIIMILWANLHGGYPLGLILILGTIIGETLKRLLGVEKKEILNWREIGELSLWLGVSILAVLLNPNGILIWFVPFQTVNVGALQSMLDEWASPNFHDSGQLVFLLMFFLPIFLNGISRRSMDMVDTVVLLVFGGMAFIARRNFGPFALVTAPIISRQVEAAWETIVARNPNWLVWIIGVKKRNSTGGEKSLSNSVRYLINGTIIGLLLLTFGVKIYSVSQTEAVKVVEREMFPVDAVAWMKLNQTPGNLLNEYNSGGFLTWFLRERPVFIDGRTDLFGDEIIGDWFLMIQAGKDWQSLIKRYQIKTVMLSPGRPILERLKEAGWRTVYEDNQTIIMTDKD
ncbi:MAG: hypothetical protein LWX83_10260 [Anaerolineae bacterium]|nr:hypothetical protein [Anaerolineae bacterium]